MVAMGIVPRPKDSLGIEATGVVKRVGSAVKHIQVDDRVIVIGSGLFATQKILPGHSVFRMPDHLSFEQGVSMPVVYATALYALVKLGQLEKGQVRQSHHLGATEFEVKLILASLF
jgi:NADPH:quinone reductase-like Zn-dependent oxidoreductase